jgi:hypothetical protein
VAIKEKLQKSYENDIPKQIRENLPERPEKCHLFTTANRPVFRVGRAFQTKFARPFLKNFNGTDWAAVFVRLRNAIPGRILRATLQPQNRHRNCRAPWTNGCPGNSLLSGISLLALLLIEIMLLPAKNL